MFFGVVISIYIYIHTYIFRIVAWRKAGRSLKGFGGVPEVTACAPTVGFSVRRVRAPLIDRLGFLAEGRWPGGRPVLP